MPWLALKRFFVALWYAFWFAYSAIWFIPMLILAVVWNIIFYELPTAFHPQPTDFIQRLRQLGVTAKSGQASHGGPLFPAGVFVPFGISLGLAKQERVRYELEIVEGPIEKIRVLDIVQGDNESFTVETRTCYCVCDPRLESARNQLLVHTQRVKAPSLIGRVVDVRWVGSDLGLGVIDRLSADPSIKLGVMESSDVGISVNPKLPGWCVFTKGATIPSKSMWELYNSIARLLLEVPIPPGVSPSDSSILRSAWGSGKLETRGRE